MKPNATRQQLIDHGLKLAAQKGLRGLIVREVAASAGVNLGSFVYHFGSRDCFIGELVEAWYAPMFDRLKTTVKSCDTSRALESLSVVMNQLLKFVGDNSPFISHLFADAAAGEPAAQAFLLTVPGRHPQLILELIRRAQTEGDIIKEPPLNLMLFVIASTGMPLLIGGGLGLCSDWLPQAAMQLTNLLNDRQAARQRLHWALKGISLSGERI